MEPIVKKLNFDLPETPDFNLDNIVNEFIQELLKREDEIFTSALRKMAEPPIKGEITKVR
jgi:hypothetical protein